MLGDAELFETGVATPRPAQDVALQTVQQGDVAALAEEEVGAGAQVFLQLPARTAGHRLQGTLAQPCAPQAGEQQQQRCRQGLGEVAGEQGGEAVAFGAVEQGHLVVLGQVPEQPGVVVLLDVAVLPDPGVGEHRDQALAVLHLQQVGGVAAVGPGVGVVLRIVEVVVGIEADVGRRALVFQVQAGQCGIVRHAVGGLFFLAGGVLRRRFGRVVVDATFVGVGVGVGVGGFLAGPVLAVVEVLGEVLADIQAVEQQVAALLLVLVPQAFGDQHQVPALLAPLQQAASLAGSHAGAAAEQEQGMPGGRQLLEDLKAVGAAHRDPLLAQEQFGGQVGIAPGLRRWAEVDRLRIGLQAAGQEDRQQPGQQQEHGKQQEARAPAHHGLAPAAKRLRQPSQRRWRVSSAGSRWP